MKKMLMLASVASMIDQFNMSNIQILRNNGIEVHVAANFKFGNTSSIKRLEEFKKELEEKDITYYHLDISRKVTHIFSNFKAFKQINKLLKNNEYDFIHVHSPIGALIGRLVAKINNVPVIYTAHGFHFFNGSSIKSWLVYYPIERFLAKFTELIIVINKEDYWRAKNFKANKVIYVPGIGVNTDKFREMNVNSLKKREELGIPKDAFVVLSVGELNKNKNHEIIIRALAKLNNPNLYYVLCGQGNLEKYLFKLARDLGVVDNVIFLGFRNDVKDIYNVCDIFAFPSKREGLGMAALEAMASGLPLVASNIHGIRDYAIEGETGFYISKGADNVDDFANAIKLLKEDNELRSRIELNNIEYVKKFDISNIERNMEEIYYKFIKRFT